jgi:hypothetical protein
MKTNQNGQGKSVSQKMSAAGKLRVVGLLAAGVLSVGLGGCGPSKVSAIETVATPGLMIDGVMSAVEVDLVGVSKANEDLVVGTGVSQWFSLNSPVRQQIADQGMIKSISFGSGQQTNVTVSSGDPVWGKWKDKGVEKVMVFAKPAAIPMSGDVAWRRSISLMSEDWQDAKGVIVRIDRSGLNTAPAGK